MLGKMNREEKKLYAAGIGLGLCSIGILAWTFNETARYEEKKDHPDEMRILVSPETRVYKNRTTIAPARYLTVSLHDMLDCPHDTIKETPEEYRNTWDTKALNAEDKICLWAAFDPYRQKAYKEKIAHDSADAAYRNHHSAITPEEIATQIDFQNRFSAGLPYVIWEGRSMAAARQEIQENPALHDAQKHWLPQNDYRNRQQATEQHRMKENALRLISDIVRKNFDLPPVPVHLFDMGENYRNILGLHDPETNEININYAWHLGVTDTLEKALDTLLEEVKHSIDYDYEILLVKDQLPPDHPARLHAAAYALNQKYYISTNDPALSSAFSNLNIASYKAYKTQYIERNAKDFSNRLRKQIMRDQACHEPGLNWQCAWKTAISPF